MKFEEILETCKTNNHAKSWDEFAWMLGLSTEGLRLIRKGRGALKPATLEAIMRGSGLEAPLIVATWEAEHGKNAHVRESWQRLATAWTQKGEGENANKDKELEKLSIMLNRARRIYSEVHLKNQELPHFSPRSQISEFSPMRVRTGVTWSRPEEMTAPAAPWTGPDRRREPRNPWHGPERRAA